MCSVTAYLGVAQFGSVLEWGSRGRRFESSHPDFSKPVCAGFFFVLILFRIAVRRSV